MKGLLVVFCLFYLISCKVDPFDPVSVGYPLAVSEIIMTECAVDGCHNSASYEAAGGLNLETWSHMMEGGNNGAAVIPFRHGFSPLFIFTNTFSHLGPQAEPVMPFNEEPLSEDEVRILMDWINAGAPDHQGNIAFQNSTDKAYVTNQGCDVVTVFDAESGNAMRYVDVGVEPGVESPHMIKVSNDGRFWFVIFSGGQFLQKFDAETDQLISSINLALTPQDAGSWNTMAITDDADTAYVVDWSDLGKVAVVDLVNNQLLYYVGPLEQPHGSMISPDKRYLYVTSQIGNYVHKIDLQDLSDVQKVSLDGNPPNNLSSLNPHEIIASPDGNYYFVSCQGTNQVNVMQFGTDALVDQILVSKFPQELAISKKHNLLIVSCTQDDVTFFNHIGSVDIIDIGNLSRIKTLKAGFQPHGLAVDDSRDMAWVANRNIAGSGPAPHHTTECEGRNGYLTAINLQTMEMTTGFRPEVSVDPYSMDIRLK